MADGGAVKSGGQLRGGVRKDPSRRAGGGRRERRGGRAWPLRRVRALSSESPWSRRWAATSDPWKSLERDPQDRWGRAAARTLPTTVGTGCRPSVTSSRRLGCTPCRAAWTRDPGHDLPRLRARCAMPPTPRATRPHRSRFRATSADVSATSDHTPSSLSACGLPARGTACLVGLEAPEKTGERRCPTFQTGSEHSKLSHA